MDVCRSRVLKAPGGDGNEGERAWHSHEGKRAVERAASCGDVTQSGLCRSIQRWKGCPARVPRADHRLEPVRGCGPRFGLSQDCGPKAHNLWRSLAAEGQDLLPPLRPIADITQLPARGHCLPVLSLPRHLRRSAAPCGYQVPAGRLEAEVHLHFPWPVRRDMRSGQFRDAVERIEYDPDTDKILVLWRKTEA